MINLLSESIQTLNHARIFISSKQQMHKDGQLLYEETINKLQAELDRLIKIEAVRDIWVEHKLSMDEIKNNDENESTQKV